jgi:integrase
MLTSLEITHAKPGMHADGGGLYLLVNKDKRKSWIFRYQVNGRRREMGIGPLADLTVTQARAKAEDLKALTKKGRDPLEERRQEEAETARLLAEQAREVVLEQATFRAVAAEYMRSHGSGWKNPKHAQQWKNTLQTYAYPRIGDRPVREVTTDDVLEILKPIWMAKPETASRLRSRIELIVSYAKARGWFEGENPALWRGHLAALLPAKSKVKQVTHHAALPWAQMAKFVAKLSGMQGMGARALEFTILTAARSGEVRGARWSEIDLKEKIWTVPAKRMKARKEHRVPLSDTAIALLERLPRVPDDAEAGDELLFAGAKSGRPLSDMSLSAVLRRMPVEDEMGAVTVHGFRSSFRDWASEATFHHPDVVELSLAHTIGNKVEAAYRRGDMLEKRRALMDDWETWCLGRTARDDE